MSTFTKSRLFKEPMTLLTAVETVESDGRLSTTFQPLDIMGAFRLRVSMDIYNDGVVATDEIQVYVAPDLTVKVGDRLTVRGDTYEVVSMDFPVVNFRRSELHHKMIRGRRSLR